MRTKYFICATRIIKDEQENKVSAIDIFENFVSSIFPAVFPRFSVLWLVDKDQGDNEAYPCQIKIKLNNEQIGLFDTNIDFQGADSTRVMLVIGGLVVPRPGSFVVSAEVGGETKAQYQFTIGGAPAAIGQENAQGATFM